MQITKAAVFGGSAVLMHGCGFGEPPAPKKHEKQETGLDSLVKLDADKVSNAIEVQAKKLLKTLQFKAAASNLITSASAVIPSHSSLDQFVQGAVKVLHDFEGDANEGVKKAYEHLHKQLALTQDLVKNNLGKNVKDIDTKAHNYFLKAMDGGHKEVIKTLDDINKKAKESGIDKQAVKFDDFVKGLTGVDLHSHNAVASGLDLLTQIATQGNGVEDQVRQFVDGLHIDNHMISADALRGFAGKNVDDIQKKVRDELHGMIESAQDGLKTFQKDAKEVMDHRVEYINNAKAAVSEAQQAVNDVVKK